MAWARPAFETRPRSLLVSPRTTPRQARDEYASPPTGLRRYFRLPIIATVVVVAALLVASLPLLDEPNHVSRLTVANPSEYALDVAVTSGGRHGWLALSGVPVGATREFHDVFDQGDTWVFSFRAQGRDGGELSISRTDLEARSWNITVPAQVLDHLRAAGAQGNR
jgi:hypothetical protein